jgi:anti-sigma factor RsiW
MTAGTISDCEACREALSDYVDDGLDTAAHGAVEAHLAVCAVCGRYLDTLRETIDLCRRAERPCVDDDCLRHAIDAARRELEARGLL